MDFTILIKLLPLFAFTYFVVLPVSLAYIVEWTIHYISAKVLSYNIAIVPLSGIEDFEVESRSLLRNHLPARS